MKNLLIITQKVDSEDDILGFFVDWIREFSKYYGEVNVITLAKGNYDLPANVVVHSLGKERGSLKIVRVCYFIIYAFKLVPKSSIIFAHMSPIFALGVWLPALIFRKKIMLWYLHRSVTLRLRLAAAVCYKILTASKEGINIKGNNVIETGHGINTKKFETVRNWETVSGFKIISVGRISRIKKFDVLINAMRLLRDKNVAVNLEIIGRPIMPSDFDYLKKLTDLVNELKLNDSVLFTNYKPFRSMPEKYKSSHLVVNMSPRGGLDKSVLEAMASGCLVLTCNSAFINDLKPYESRLTFKEDNPSDLANKMEEIFRMPHVERSEISRHLVSVIDRNHNLSKLIHLISTL